MPNITKINIQNSTALEWAARKAVARRAERMSISIDEVKESETTIMPMDLKHYLLMGHAVGSSFLVEKLIGFDKRMKHIRSVPVADHDVKIDLETSGIKIHPITQRVFERASQIARNNQSNVTANLALLWAYAELCQKDHHFFKGALTPMAIFNAIRQENSATQLRLP